MNVRRSRQRLPTRLPFLAIKDMSVRNGSPSSSEGIPSVLELEVAKFQHSQFLPFICPTLSDREGVPILGQLISQSLVEVLHITLSGLLAIFRRGNFSV